MRRDESDSADDVALADRIALILSELEDVDLERVDPPSDLWGQIEASLAAKALPPRTPPARDVSASNAVEYRIDANDIVIDVGPNWGEFARANDAPELAVLPPDRTLWSYFTNDEVASLWRLLVERVRALQQRADVPIRCDTPDARRWFDMAITPASNGGVHFRCVLVFEEDRSPVSLLDPHAERDPDLQPVALCSWCGHGRHGSGWLAIEDLVHAARLLEHTSMPPVSYGVCGTCREEMSAELVVGHEIDGSPA